MSELGKNPIEFNKELVFACLEGLIDRKTFSLQLETLNLQVYNTLPSTNQTLWELIDQGASLGTAVIALEQTAGRGQRERQWLSGLGGLYISLAMNPNLEARYASFLTICAAWGIATQLRDHQIPVRLKWANDLVLNQRKLGGILTETRIHHHLIHRAVVGVGINWSNQVPDVGINLASFVDRVDSLEKLAALAIAGIFQGYSYAHPLKFKEIVPLYRQLLTSDTYADTTAESERFFQEFNLN